MYGYRCGSGLCLLTEGIVIGEDVASGSQPFVKADSLKIRLSLASLLFGRQEPASPEIRGAKILLLENTQGWNFVSLTTAGAVSTASGNAAAAPRPILLPALSIRDSQIRIHPLGEPILTATS